MAIARVSHHWGLLAAIVVWLAIMLSLPAGLFGAEPLNAAAPVAKPTVRSGQALADEIRALLRDAARHNGKPDEATVRRAVALYGEIQADTDLRAREREGLRVGLRSRLAKWSSLLAQNPAAAAGQAGAARLAEPKPQILGQVAPPGQPGQPGAANPGTGQPVDHGAELVDLIQETIVPTTWDTRGGNGVIRYWAPGHALIVRQTGDVHEQLGRLLMDMR